MRIAIDLDRYLLGLVNQVRNAAGIDSVTLEQNLSGTAFDHSTWMIENSAFSHNGINGSNGFVRIASSEFDIGTEWTWAENIGAEQLVSGTFYQEIDAIFGRWMLSPSHSANILNPDYTVVGMGITIGSLPGSTVPGVVITQNFAGSDGTHDLDIQGSEGAETLRTQNGDDHIAALGGNDLILTDAGDDTVLAGSGNDSVNAGEGADAVLGESGNDFLRGAGGDDTLRGDTGNDFLLGDAGQDNLFGGIGEDSLSGGDGNDYLEGNAGFDALQGGNGDDTLVGGAQADNLFASAGDDYLRGDAGFDRLFGGWGDDTLEGGDGPDALFGNGGSDFMYGQEGDDRNYGAGGNDFIQDAEGDDLIEAGAGFDTLDGGVGDDLIYGRFNADRFVFNDAAGGFGNDTIGDFAAANIFERIDLSNVAAITSLTDLMNNHIAQQGNDVLITAGSNSTILLQNVQLAQLDSTDFIF